MKYHMSEEEEGGPNHYMKIWKYENETNVGFTDIKYNLQYYNRMDEDSIDEMNKLKIDGIETCDELIAMS